MKSFLTLLSLCLFFTTSLFAQEIVSKKQDSGVEWGVYLDVAGTGGTAGVGFAPSVFIPIKPSDDGIVLIDLRGHLGIDGDLKNNSSGQLAVGYRHRLGDIAIGANGSVDLLTSPNGNMLSQASLGVEFFNKYVNVAMNFYAPLSKDQDTGSSSYVPYAIVEENELKMVYKDNDREVTRYGIDLFVQATIPLIDNMILELSGGVVYYFATEDYNGVFAAGASAKLSYEFDLFGQEAQAYVMADVGYSGQDGFDFMATLGLKVSLGGSKKERERQKKYNEYNEEAGFKKSSASVGTYQGILHKENATTIVDGNEYHYLYEGDANDDIVALIDGSEENALVVLNGDAGEINITQGITLKDGQYLTGTGRALTVNGPDGRTAVILVGGSRATVNGNAMEDPTPIFTLAADNTIEGLNINGGIVGIYVDNGHDAKLIDLNISQTMVGIDGSNAGEITIKSAQVSETLLGVWASGSTKLIIEESSIEGELAAIDVGNVVSEGHSDEMAIIISDSTLIGNVYIVPGAGGVSIVNSSVSEMLGIASNGEIILNGVTIGGDLEIYATAGSISIDGLEVGENVYITARRMVEILNSNILENLVIGDGPYFAEDTPVEDSLLEVVLSIVHAGGDISITNAKSINGYMVTADGGLLINNADVVNLNDSDDPFWEGTGISEYNKDGVAVDLDIDDDGVRNDLDECPSNPLLSVAQSYYIDSDGDGAGAAGSDPAGTTCENSAPADYSLNSDDLCDSNPDFIVPQDYFEDVDGDGVGHGDAVGQSCQEVAGYSFSSDDVCPNDPSNVQFTYYADTDDDTLGDPNSPRLFCTGDDTTGYVSNADDPNDTLSDRDVSLVVNVPNPTYNFIQRTITDSDYAQVNLIIQIAGSGCYVSAAVTSGNYFWSYYRLLVEFLDDSDNVVHTSGPYSSNFPLTNIYPGSKYYTKIKFTAQRR